MVPNSEGLFNAYPVEIGIDETGPNNLATCIVKFQIYEELRLTGEWADCSGDNLDITAYFYLEKKDGSLNTVTVDALKAALGWDGRDPFWLEEADLSQHPVQLKIGFEEYNGKKRLKVLFLNPHGRSPGGVTRADAPTRKSLGARLESMLQTLSGPAQPASAPAAPSAPPAPPTTPPSPPPAPPSAKPTAPAPAPEATKQEAWDALYRHLTAAGRTQAEIEQEWFRLLAELFPGKQPDELSPAEWAVMRNEGPVHGIPF